ncbi:MULTISPECIES: Dyp-type peroxidase [unclassified Photobacterium]|uniref:Dyp-type peroxidase n=1 Tax=unclassified Photobacterium TaxID=2628852 RepID=UPI000D17DC3E|nr:MULTISPECIES: Dyp-type peroxidase [unclassified Photobacterium]PSV27816.1 peroxidase [Photobacterium sp. GB-56]PSV32042.1 peroxidase [Photobacterium sp. GB-72]PSV32770.1 peroxidase [Photobacterium sp. GB-27]PSV38480.1 peroxidase [Photobacterium sp. GB-210]PSV41420.1 peroxidase [Photobacterium sp. GB-36]
MNTQLSELAQPGAISNPNTFAEYLTFIFKENIENDDVTKIFAKIQIIEKSIAQKDPSANLSLTIGISNKGWPTVFPDVQAPSLLHDFIAMTDGERSFPSTPGDIFIMIKSERMDINFQAAKYIAAALQPVANLIEDIQGFKYLDNRDMIDFVDGTENPKNEARFNAVLVDNDRDIHQGGTYLTVQRYVDRQGLWDKQTTEYQEQVIGRTKLDDIELDDDQKPAWAHNNKSKVIIDDQEIKMLRQNRPFGNAMEHGTMFVGFAASPEILDISLKQMIYADENGNYDRLLDFVEAKTGTHYFVPSQTLMNTFAG